MNIAIVGTRGIPNRYGGFERFAEQISSRFADHGHRVTVYCRRAFTRPTTFTIAACAALSCPACIRSISTPGSAPSSRAVHVAFSDNDIVLLCNVANSPFAYIPRLFGKPVVLNVDGLDRKREKWARPGRAGAALLRMDVVVQLQPAGDRRQAPFTITTSPSTAASRPSSATARRCRRAITT